MKTRFILLSLLLITVFSNAQQTTAIDFSMDDCNGQMHHLYSELDSGNVVILEFFMLSCNGCIVAGDALEAMHHDLEMQYGEGKIRFYHFGYSNTYTCSSISNWVTTNGYSSTPFDSGGTQVAYYGGMGMPTIAVVAGSAHDVLFTNVGFSDSDTDTIATAIKSFLGTNAGIQNESSAIGSIEVFPNPCADNFTLSLVTKESGMLRLELTDIVGKKVQVLAIEKLEKGIWNQSFPVNYLSSGIYFIKGEFNDKIFLKKISIQE